MGQLLVKNKSIVVPGEELAKGMDYLPGNGTYRVNDEIIASRLGLINVDGRALKIIPLSGKYIPKKNDVIIGQIVDITFSGWRVETNSAYPAMLNVRDATSDFINRGADLAQYFNLGDYIAAKITNVTSQKLVDLTMKGPGLHKLKGGRIILVNTNKVPRIIGKQGSMVSMIKQATDCRIMVGQNGVVWVQGSPENELVAIEAIKKIEAQAHMTGLTDEIKKFLEKATKEVKK